MRKKFLLLTGLFVAAIIGATFNFGVPHASATVPGTNTLISTNSSGTSTTPNGSSEAVVSANGKFAAFDSNSNYIVSSDTNYTSDVYVRDLSANTVSRVSVTSAGGQATGPSLTPVISETGRYVVFKSMAPDLISGVTVPTTYYQLYLHDTQANTTTLLTQDSTGNAANASSIPKGVSSDGRFVLFTSGATNLTAAATNAGQNIYMLDRATNTFTILNYKYDGTLPNNIGTNTSARMSCDGSLVAFSTTNDLGPIPSTHYDIYLLDRRAGNRLTNLTGAANGAAAIPSISCNGDYIGFTSYATNLDPASGSSPAYTHAYVYNRINQTFTIADRSTSGALGTTNVCGITALDCVQISDNGVAVFAAPYTANLVTGATGTQLYIHDLNSGSTELLSQNSSGTPGNHDSAHPTISMDGSIVGYSSYATNLVSATDTNSAQDAFTSLTGH